MLLVRNAGSKKKWTKLEKNECAAGGVCFIFLDTTTSCPPRLASSSAEFKLEALKIEAAASTMKEF